MTIFKTAYAMAGGQGDGQQGIMSLFLMVAIFAIFYFLLIRPQQKKAKQHRQMVDDLRRGDKIVTGGGFVGTVARVIDDRYIAVDLADNVRVRCMRATISDVLARTEPITDDLSDDDSQDASEAASKKKQPRKSIRKPTDKKTAD